MRPPGDAGPGGPPPPPSPPLAGATPFPSGFVGQLCNVVSSCLYFLCCCWLIEDCFGSLTGPIASGPYPAPSGSTHTPPFGPQGSPGLLPGPPPGPIGLPGPYETNGPGGPAAAPPP